MIRLKFLIFAFLAVGLGLAHLFLLSGPMEAQALREAQVQAGSGTAEVMRTLEARRGIARALALKLAGSPELVSSAQQMTEPEAPAAERFAAVRAAAEALLPKEQQGVVLGVVTEAGAWHVRSGGEPSSDAAVLDVKALTQGETPLVVEAFGAPHTFAAVPLVWKFVRIPGAERLEVRLDATLVVGVPLLPEGVLDSAATASGVSALAVVKEQTVVASGGAQKALVDSLKEQLKAGEPAKAVKRGQLQALGPVKLPMLTTGKDFLGGQAVLEVGTRRAVEGTSYEVIAIASPKLMGTLAAYQRGALFGLLGLLGASVLWTVIMGSGKRGASEQQAQGGDTLSLSNAMQAMGPPPQPFTAEPVTAPTAPSAAALAASASPYGEVPPETHPGLQLTGATPVEPEMAPAPPLNDFPFGPPPESVPQPYEAAQPPAPAEPAAAEPFAFPPTPEPLAPEQPLPYESMATPFDGEITVRKPEMPLPSVSTAAPRAGAFNFEELPTAAYSLQQAADPYAAASALDDNPETTRVAAIPRELLQAAARPATMDVPTVHARPSAPPPQVSALAPPVPWNEPSSPAIPLPGAAYQSAPGSSADAFSEEEFHFQEVFREFVLTRERCMEAADGLTYDKFVQKLRKNKEQLMSKYACRTVKFQVYVKENKAALKATPVKD
ncbi:MAG TPA: MXAN_5187 family protein [Myxococcaceae bacterium]|nr:MXAN_5187 family protein [Myxococcaceae bacterium]